MLRKALQFDLSLMQMWWPFSIPLGEWIQIKVHTGVLWSPGVALQMNALPELRAAGFAHALTLTSLPPTGKAIKRTKTVEFADVGRKWLLSLASVIYMNFYKHTHTCIFFFFPGTTWELLQACRIHDTPLSVCVILSYSCW